ncbi:hypothetical protein [Aliiruegeria haliotis]|nr:hypothetical protein [Aliiruegeria haliotis]
MSFVRPEVRAVVARWRDVLVSLGVALVGLWLISLGGVVLGAIGGAVTLAALALGLIALRRMRFRMEIEAPGVVEIDEGRISYMGPITGGAVGVSALREIEVLDVAGQRRCWRLVQDDGQALLVPLAAAGAEQLYDVFSTLPKMNGRALMSVPEPDTDMPLKLWRRPLETRQLPVL